MTKIRDLPRCSRAAIRAALLSVIVALALLAPAFAQVPISESRSASDALFGGAPYGGANYDYDTYDWPGTGEEAGPPEANGDVSTTVLESTALKPLFLSVFTYAPAPRPKSVAVYSIRKIVFRDLLDWEDLTIKVTVDTNPEVIVSVPSGGTNTLTLDPAKPSNAPMTITVSENHRAATYNATLSKPADGILVYDVGLEELIFD